MKPRNYGGHLILHLLNAQAIETVQEGQQHNLCDYWADTSLHVRLLKSSMAQVYRGRCSGT